MTNKKRDSKKKQKHSKKRVKLTPEQKDRRRKRKESKRRKEELKRLLRKKSRERGPNPHSAVRYHKTYAYDKIRFTVLTASQMTKERQEMVAATLKTVTTGPEAMTLPETPGW